MEQPNTTAVTTPEPALAPAATTPALPPATGAASSRGRRRVKQGRVASSKMDKTIVVVSETRVPHRVYGKIVRKSNRFKAHDERNEANVGDTVRIVECRPMSKEKRWRLIEIVERAK